MNVISPQTPLSRSHCVRGVLCFSCRQSGGGPATAAPRCRGLARGFSWRNVAAWQLPPPLSTAGACALRLLERRQSVGQRGWQPALVPALCVAAASPVCADSSVKCWAGLPPKVEVTSSRSFLFVFLFPEFLCFHCNKGWAELVLLLFSFSFFLLLGHVDNPSRNANYI